MAASFRLETTGAREIEARLGDLIVAFGDLRPLMDTFGGILEGSARENFAAESAPDGTKWKPSQRVLKDGGLTLTGPASKRSPGAFLRQSIHYIAASDSVQVGTNLIYAGIHQFGFDGNVTVKAHSRTIREAFGVGLASPVTFEVKSFERMLKMPARPYLGISADDEAELIAQTEDFARDALGSTGGAA